MVFSEIKIIDGEQYVGINMFENEILKSKRLEQALNEIKDYINNNSHHYSTDDGSIGFVIEEEKEETFCNDILQIIDKVLGEEK